MVNFSVLRIIACTLGGTAAAFVGIVSARRLLKRRNKQYTVPAWEEKLLFPVGAVMGAALAIFTRGIAPIICGLLLETVCLAVTLTDQSSRVIPNSMVLAVLLLALVFGLPGCFGLEGWLRFSPVRSLIGLAVCFAIFFLPGLFGKSVGAGDVKLAAAMGFLLGYDFALTAIFLMGVFVLGYSLLQRKMPILRFLKTSIPMGPFIAAGMMFAFVAMNYMV